MGGPYVDPTYVTPAGLGTLPDGCIGSQITHDFTSEDMFFQALLLHWEGVPADMLWQNIIGLHLLSPYGLFPVTDSADTPNAFFTYNQKTLEALLSANPSLQQEPVNLVNPRPRPYVVCNTAMFMTSDGQSLLAPVQATSFMTGIVSMPPNATDANGFQVGGGGVASFAFNSAPTAFNSSTSVVTVQQQRQWALVDIVGVSSAAFAAVLAPISSAYTRSPDLFAAALRERGPVAVNFLARTGMHTARSRRRLASTLAAHAQGDASQLQGLAWGLERLIPAYRYRPVLNPPINQTINPSEFADGGSPDNTGIAATLAYNDIQNIIAFSNTSTPLAMDQAGTIVVDDSIPPLFGYQPYVEGTGYVLYQGAAYPNSPLYQHNQVFPSEAFWDLLNNFPHYSTFDTELTPTEINLLANFTAWVILSAQNTFTALFQPAAAAS